MNSLLHNLIAVWLFALAAFPAIAATPAPPAVPRGYVTDLAGAVRPDTLARVNALLRELEAKTGVQVMILTVDTLDGESIDGFAVEQFKRWKPGQQGRDNGVLVAVAVKDRAYRIEVGYGLEGILPDSLVGSIGREYFVPFFRKGDYGTGIHAGTLAIARTIAAGEGISIGGGQAPRQPEFRQFKSLTFMQKVMVGIFGVIVLILFITHPGQCFLLILASQMGGRGGWSGGGGGFGGGGFGGGGGRSGGGGASGGW